MNALPEPVTAFKPLVRWLKVSRKSVRQASELIGISHSTLSRAMRGLQPLAMEDQLALEKITGIPPAEWAEFYAERVRARGRSQKKSADVEVVA